MRTKEALRPILYLFLFSIEITATVKVFLPRYLNTSPSKEPKEYQLVSSSLLPRGKTSQWIFTRKLLDFDSSQTIINQPSQLNKKLLPFKTTTYKLQVQTQ